MYQKILTDVSIKAKETISVDPDDYIKDGLLYCHKCNTPKQRRVHAFGKDDVVFMLCECANERKVQRELQEKREERLKELTVLREDAFPTSALKEKMSEWNFENDNCENPYISQIARNYVNNFKDILMSGKGILFYGDTGVGKSFISVCIMNALLDEGVSCGYIDFPRLSSEVRGRQDKQEYIDGFNRFKLLVADDLGAESDSSYSLEITYNLINTRYLAGLPIIVTTNLTAERLKNPHDMQEKRLFSRLFDMCVPTEYKGTDRRKKKLSDEFGKYSEMLGVERK